MPKPDNTFLTHSWHCTIEDLILHEQEFKMQNLPIKYLHLWFSGQMLAANISDTYTKYIRELNKSTASSSKLWLYW